MSGPADPGRGPRPDFRVMGVVNVTPDSFSDGGRYLDTAAAIGHGIELAAAGAAILDVGGESTRPGAEPVSAVEERARVVPVIEGLRAGGVRVPISVDTSKAEVAAAALDAGAEIVNDVTALRGDPEMADLVAARDVPVCLTHMQGEPRTMQIDPAYADVVAEVRGFLAERLAHAVARGVVPERVWLDPGIGFGKTTAHNLALLRDLEAIVELGAPVVVGASRKGFLGQITGRPPDGRTAATVAANVLAYERGARIFRVHDVAPVLDGLAIAAATVGRPWPSRRTPTTTTT